MPVSAAAPPLECSAAWGGCQRVPSSASRLLLVGVQRQQQGADRSVGCGLPATVHQTPAHPASPCRWRVRVPWHPHDDQQGRRHCYHHQLLDQVMEKAKLQLRWRRGAEPVPAACERDGPLKVLFLRSIPSV